MLGSMFGMKERFIINYKVHAHNLKPLECSCMFIGHRHAGSYLCLCMNMYALVVLCCCVLCCVVCVVLCCVCCVVCVVCCVVFVCVCVLQGWQRCMKCEVDSVICLVTARRWGHVTQQ